MIATMGTMKRFVRSHRLQSDSDPEITEAFEHAVLDLTRSVQFQGRKLRPGPLLNALVVWWMAQDGPTRIRIARDGIEKLEALLSDTPADVAGKIDAPAGDIIGQAADPKTGEPLKKPGKSKRSG